MESLKTYQSRSQPWSAEEKQRLYELCQQGYKPCEILASFPDRSKKALNMMKSKIKASSGNFEDSKIGGCVSFGVAPTILDRDDPGISDDEFTRWRRQARHSNAMFLNALARAGMVA